MILSQDKVTAVKGKRVKCSSLFTGKTASIELSVNMIVVMIICIIILGAGIYLLLRGQEGFEKEYEKVRSLRESQIRGAMARSGEPVLVYPNTVTLDRGEKYVFALGITNYLGRDENFWIKVMPAVSQPDDNAVLYIKNKALRVSNTQTYYTPIMIETSKVVGKTSYIFNVCIYNSSYNPLLYVCPDESIYGSMQKVIVNVR